MRALRLALIILTVAGGWAVTELFVTPLPAVGQPQPAGQAWRANFPTATTVKSAGEYRGSGQHPVLRMESFSSLCLEPSATASFRVVEDKARRSLAPEGTTNYVVFQDTQPGLQKNPNPPPFYQRAPGTVSAFAWGPGEFSDVMLTGEFNLSGGADRKGAQSRQGLMARWDHGNNHYWFYINFNSGTYGIVRSRFFGVLMDDLPGTTGKVRNFGNTKPYYLEFQLVKDRVRGKAFERTSDGKLDMVGDTGWVQDANPQMSGVSAVLFETWIEAPFVPLEGSFANLTSTPCPQGGKPCDPVQ